MTANDERFSFEAQQPASGGHTIDLQGVAAFAGLVELLATELGTTAGKIQGHMPSGPASLEQLVGEILVTSQGYYRHLTLLSCPNYPLRMRIFTSFRDPAQEASGTQPRAIEVQVVLGSPVEKILPQGRALARHVEELFAVVDKMLSLGISSKLAAMSISDADLARLEQQEGGSLIQSSYRQRSDVR